MTESAVRQGQAGELLLSGVLDFTTAEQSITNADAVLALISAWPCLRKAGPVL